MINLLKTALQLLMFIRQPSDESGEKNIFKMRRFWGLTVLLASSGLAWKFGVQIEPEVLDTLTENITVAVTAAWGVIALIIGIINKEKKK